MKVLECSSAGDMRFSAFGAKVEAFGTFDSIENHYQLAKRFVTVFGELEAPSHWKEAKGKTPVLSEIGGKLLPIDYLSMYYSLLWVKYFDQNPGLLRIAEQYDEFHDRFKGGSKVCQADVIRDIVRHGRKYVMDQCKPLIEALNEKTFVYEVTGDLFDYPAHALGHQVNAQGVMGAGIAVTVKELYPEAFKEYNLMCKAHSHEKHKLMGHCQLVQVDRDKWVANLFGQERYGYSGCYTDYEALKQSLQTLKDEAVKNNWIVALPKYIGAGKAGGDWKIIREIIENVFCDYPVTLVEKVFE